MRQLTTLIAIGLFLFCAVEVSAANPEAGDDPYWILIHEPAAIAELKLSSGQRAALQKRTDELDLRYFPLRNKSPEVARVEASKLTSEARDFLKTILQPPQQKRLNELSL